MTFDYEMVILVQAFLWMQQSAIKLMKMEIELQAATKQYAE